MVISPVRGCVQAEQRSHELASPRAHQPEDAEHLARAQRERGLAQRGRARDGKHLERHPAGHARRALREQRGDAAADHRRDQLVVRHRRELAGGDGAAIAQDGVGRGDRARLLEEVADVEHGHAPRGEAADQREQPVDVAARQAAGRLVHQHHARPRGDRAADLDHLPRADRQRAHARVGVDLGVAELGQHLARAPPGGRAVDEPAAARLLADEDVLGDREVREERQLLVDEGDPGLARLARRARRVRARRRARGGPSRPAAGRRRSRAACSCRRRSRRPAPAPRRRAARASRRRAQAVAPKRLATFSSRRTLVIRRAAGDSEYESATWASDAWPPRVVGLSAAPPRCQPPTSERLNGPTKRMTRRICRSGGSSAASFSQRPALSTAPGSDHGGQARSGSSPGRRPRWLRTSRSSTS